MAWPTQCSGGGWAVDKLMGSLGRTPITGPKMVKGVKMVNLVTAGSIKRP